MNEYTVITASISEIISMIKEVVKESLSDIETSSSEVYPNIMDTNGAMKYLGVSKSTMYKMTMNREIPFYKPTGKRNYFKRNELDDWLLKHRVKPMDEIEHEATDYIQSKKY